MGAHVDAEADLVIKLLLLGDSGVGKTCLLTRFTHNSFDEHIASTIGVDFAVKRITVYNRRVKLTVWDTAGQEKFRTLTSTFYRGAKGVILVYDCSRPDTLRHLEEQWMRELELYGTADAMRMVVANKIDVGHARRVSWLQGSEFARRHGCLFAETSAKDNVAVAAAFEELVLKILDTPSLVEACEAPRGSVRLDQAHPASAYDYCYC